MKKKEERNEKQMAEVIAENKRLTEPLQKAREEVEDLRRQLSNYEKDKEMLRVRILSTAFFCRWPFLLEQRILLKLRDKINETMQWYIIGIGKQS